MNPEVQQQLRRFQPIGWSIGIIGLVLCAIGGVFNPRQACISYLFAFTFWTGLSLGCATVAMIHYLAGGRWGFLVRRVLEAGFMTLPIMALLFVPLCFGTHELYPWSHPEVVAASETLQKKTVYLNLPGYVVRSFVCFGLWIVLTRLLRRWSLEQDTTSDPAPTIRLRTLSGPGLVLHLVLGTFAFIDWIMAIDPEWHSSMFPVIVLIGQVLSAFAFSTLMLGWLAAHPPFQERTEPRQFHDLGNLLLAFVMFWTYISFSQFLIIYSGDLPTEIQWYQQRSAPGWVVMLWLLFLAHFIVPFLLLLFRSVKRSVPRLVGVAALVFLAQMLGVFWLIAPSFHPGGLQVHGLDLAALVGIGGVWLARFAGALNTCPLLPQNDPRIEYPVPITAHAK